MNTKDVILGVAKNDEKSDNLVIRVYNPNKGTNTATIIMKKGIDLIIEHTSFEELYEIGVTSVIGVVDSAKIIEKALEEGYKSIVKTSWNVARLISTK